MSYSKLFGDKPEVKAWPEITKSSGTTHGERKADRIAEMASLFDNVHTDNSKIESWLKNKSITNISAGKINFILNGVPPEKVSTSHINDIGKFHLDEASEANRWVDRAVAEFSELKPHLEAPKQLILDSIRAIEEGSKAQGWISRLRREPAPDINKIMQLVSNNSNQALSKSVNCAQYRVTPFINKMNDLKVALEKILGQLDNCIHAMNYLIDNNQDSLIQDLCHRKIAVFGKSQALMRLNSSQIDDMISICEENRNFSEELKLNIIPVISTVVRHSVISGSMQDIAAKMKAIV